MPMFLSKLFAQFSPAVFIELFEEALIFGVDDPGAKSPLDNYTPHGVD
jgi:hypothetical protein